MNREEKLSYLVSLANSLLQSTTYEKSPLYREENYGIPYDRTKSLFDEGWRFQWNRGKKRIGCCSYKDKTIELSYIYAENVEDPEALRNTILHEIAHALTPGEHHSKVWMKACIAVGARPERLCNDPQVVNANSVLSGWQAKCEHCERTHKKFRRPKYINSMHCASSSLCKRNKTALKWVKV